MGGAMSAIKVISSDTLDDKMKSKVENAFRSKHTESVEFVYDIDPSLIGGILVIDGDRYYDASVRGQLAVIKRNLK